MDELPSYVSLGERQAPDFSCRSQNSLTPVFPNRNSLGGALGPWLASWCFFTRDECQGQFLMHHDRSCSTSSDCVAWFSLCHALSSPLSLVSYMFLNLVLQASNGFGRLPGISLSNLFPPKISSIGIYGVQQRTLVTVTQFPSVDLNGPLCKMRCLK